MKNHSLLESGFFMFCELSLLGLKKLSIAWKAISLAPNFSQGSREEKRALAKNKFCRLVL